MTTRVSRFTVSFPVRIVDLLFGSVQSSLSEFSITVPPLRLLAEPKQKEPRPTIPMRTPNAASPLSSRQSRTVLAVPSSHLSWVGLVTAILGTHGRFSHLQA